MKAFLKKVVNFGIDKGVTWEGGDIGLVITLVPDVIYIIK